MNSLNSMLLEGNVVRDPVLKETPKGTPVCTFSIASNRYYKQEDAMEKETSFFEVETWGKLAESCGKNCVKGRGVRVVGRMKQDRWVGSDGKNYSKVKLVGEHVEFKPVFSKHMAETAAEPERSAAGEGDATQHSTAVLSTGGTTEVEAMPAF